MNVMLLLLAEVAENVVLGVAENLDRHGVMMILQRRHVFIAHSQLRLRIYLIPTSTQPTKRELVLCENCDQNDQGRRKQIFVGGHQFQ